jgi:hypothetical protein
MDHKNAGLMGFWSDIDESYEARYREWHTTEHIPERVGIPGFLTGQRYARVRGGREYFMFYDTESVAVLGSEAYLKALNAPTPWTLESLRHFKNPLRNLYRKLAERGDTPSAAARYVTCIRFNREVRPGSEHGDPSDAEFFALETGDWARIRYFEIDEAATGKKTRERNVYGEQPESQRYLYIVDRNVEPTTLAIEHLQKQLAAIGMKDAEVELYRLDFAMTCVS